MIDDAYRVHRLEYLLLEAHRMGVERLETAIESIADDDSDEAGRTRAALVAALEEKRQREGET